MTNEIFIADINEHVGELSKTSTLTFRFESYVFEEKEGERFLVGEGSYKSVIQEDLEIESVNFLLSLINLVKGELPKNYFHRYPRNDLDTVISDDDILNWVKIYGFPFLNQEKILYLNLNILKRKLAMLKARFLIWKAILEEEPGEIDKYKMSLLNLESNKRENPKKDELTIIKKSLAEEVGNWGTVNIRLKYNEETNSNVFHVTANSLLGIAYYQLGMLLTKKDTENKKRLRHCANRSCNNLFWTKHSRTKFCDKCDRRKVFYESKKNKPSDS